MDMGTSKVDKEVEECKRCESKEDSLIVSLSGVKECKKIVENGNPMVLMMFSSLRTGRNIDFFRDVLKKYGHTYRMGGLIVAEVDTDRDEVINNVI